jgi:uncharacterized SAM-binding protein YcdF (DUF218 family)
MPALILLLKRAAQIGVAAIMAASFLAPFAHVSFLRELASFLIIEDSLEPAAAIVSLAGEAQPAVREIEAARLYRAGWAPLIIIVRAARHQDSQAVQGPRSNATQPWELSRETLVREGVPASAILIIRDEAQNTFQELQAVYRALPSKESRLVLVTSKFHTRRTRLTWEHVTGGRSQAIVRSVERDSLDPTRW